ncbi:hypothetical protein [Mycolicibacterium sp.]|uniref:hypothetical protein n=1 Tax=Mycolicibacterium sp. TaxID=2320850 RepID=UPI001A1852FB|nr:hypothetical protein [Mycolicibacterium sp.]MBJ7337273.1 hypothetical protein [Mycolicibacterium sp.]
MATAHDAGARLAEGRPTIADVEEYVAACRRLGYAHRDLTMHPTQVRDWYGSEEGLDLRAVDADAGALSAAASAAQDAARTQTKLAADLSAAWSGAGAASAHQFIWRSCQAATDMSVALRTAAEVMGTLRDELWRAVDAKVVATEAVDARQRPRRAEWLAAAKTVTTGTGDLATASELVELEVKPFVDIDVGSDWTAAMRTAMAAVNAAYDAAIAEIRSAPTAVFGVPGELGPRPPSNGGAEVANRRETEPASALTAPAAAVGSVAPMAPSVPPPAAAWSVPTPATPGPPPAPPETAAPPSTPTLPASAMAPSAPSMPSLGDLGAGTSTLGSGLSGFGQQLADLIGGLVGSADGGLPDDGLPDTAMADESADEADPQGDLPTEGDTKAEEDPDAQADPAPDDPVEEPMPKPTPAEEDPTPTSIPPPPPLDPAPAPQGLPEPVADGAEPTPCEIAADELPQVGE